VHVYVVLKKYAKRSWEGFFKKNEPFAEIVGRSLLTEKVVGLGPSLLKSFSGYPNSGGTIILHYCEVNR